MKGIGCIRERQEMEGNCVTGTKDRAREKSASSTRNKSISGIPIEHPQTAANNQFQVYALNFSVSLPHICLWHSTCFYFLVCVCVIPYKYHLHVYVLVKHSKAFYGKISWGDVSLLSRWSCKQLIKMVICSMRWMDMELFFFIDSSDCEIRICLLVLLIFIQTKNCVWRKDETLTRNLILILFHKIVNCLYFLFLFVCSFRDTLKRIIQFFSQIFNLILYL